MARWKSEGRGPGVRRAGCRAASVAAAVLLLAGVAGGCSPPSASLELIAVARQGMAAAKQAQQQYHQREADLLASQAAALDAAFDADVRLAAAGQITDAAGRPVPLTADWVISARKGYSAARDAVAGQIRSREASHAVEMDNLSAADEAMEMAARLILEQMSLSARFRQELMQAQERLAAGRP